MISQLVYGYVDGSGGAQGTTQFNSPGGLALDATGRLYVADSDNNAIRAVAADGATTTLAKSPEPSRLAVDATGRVYVSDRFGVRRLAPDGSSVIVAGEVAAGFAEGEGCTAQFDVPGGIVLTDQLAFVTDALNNRIRLVQLPWRSQRR